MSNDILTQFTDECAAYCAQRGIGLSSLGAYAVNDNSLFSRLDAGGQCLPRTMQRVRDYMRDNPPNALKRKGGAHVRRSA